MPSVTANELSVGNIVEHLNEMWKIIDMQHVKPGKGGAFQQVELKNILTGRKLNERFRSSETVNKLILEKIPAQYSYKSGDDFVFLRTDNYEEININKDIIGDDVVFIEDDINVMIESIDETIVGINFPETVILEVVETEPYIKGQTVTNSFKPATMSNGLRLKVPPFIEVGEKLIIKTSDRSYVERAK